MAVPADISVIIPTFRRPDGLSRAVESVLNQTVVPGEIIVVDDNSDDPDIRNMSHRLVSMENPPVRVVEHNGKRGGAAARNTGAAASTGSLLAFLDDDDYWEAEKLERQLSVYNGASADIGLVYTGLHVVSETGELIQDRFVSVSATPYHDLARRNVIGTVSSVMIPRAVFESVGGFDPDLPARQDMDLWLRIARDNSIVAVRRPLTVYVNHDKGISKNFEKKILAHELFLRKHSELYDRDRRLLAEYHYATALLCLKHQKVRLARRYLSKSCSAWPIPRAIVRYLLTWFPQSSSAGKLEQ